MAIAHVGTDSTASSATAPATLNVTKPTGVTLNSSHRLILSVGSGRTGGTVGSYTAPSGWTSVGSVLDLAGGQGHTSLQCWHAAGDVSLLGYTKSGLIDTEGWVMLAFSGVDTTTPIDATGTANSNTGSATLATNAVTIATANAWHLIAFGDWLGGTFSATSFTNAESATANETAAVLYNTTPKSTGSTGAVTVTSSALSTNQNLIGVPFALRPAAAGGGRGLFQPARLSGLDSGGSFFGNPLLCVAAERLARAVKNFSRRVVPCS